MIAQENYKLSNGISIPKLGLGTWFISDDDVVEAVKEAVKLGYRHIDTAQAYQNEAGVGKGIKESGIAREELFITSKVAAEHKSFEAASASIDETLEKMGLEYIDLMIIHSPKPWAEYSGSDRYFEGNREAWRALEEAYKAGKVKAIGVSNFQKEDLENILESATVKPMVNQILAHISNTPEDLISYCIEQNILVEAYSPIGHGELFKNEELAAMAKKYEVSVPQLAIRYCLELGLLPLPKTANPAHMANNADLDFEISAADLDSLRKMEKIEDYGEASVFPVYQ
ncbi:aldo/keto reductase [Croceimicrobium hydrocarbonivorans]|uniref:Aldo/keto reductase n=1 Tax=Croceimicrobium hydrocarbonivorans TaxID=2761580 RepID=A0A7H0VES6_9FLAO|nr:aldo/keto reductase [Croceimicrobium hydrocarbonivorans]QNR24224.1 aldo/keto reductase [Croceimicrobium hydrocarbonivorans]